MATTGQAVQVLKAELQDPKYALLGSRQVQRKLVERPLIDNPDPAPKLMRTLDSKDLAWLPESGIGDTMVARLTEIMTAGDNARLVDWARIAQVAGLLTEQQAADVIAYAEGEVADPTWPAKIPGPTRLDELGIADIVWPDGAETHNGFNAGPVDKPYDLIAEARF